jgi:hypothetical protein
MKKKNSGTSKFELSARTTKDLTVRTGVTAGCTCCTCTESNVCTSTGCPPPPAPPGGTLHRIAALG